MAQAEKTVNSFEAARHSYDSHFRFGLTGPAVLAITDFSHHLLT